MMQPLKKGEVKIYWTGVAFQSAPAQIKDTLLIINHPQKSAAPKI